MKLKISYEIELTIDESIYWKGATKQEMIDIEIKNAKEDPETYLSIAHDNGTYHVEVTDS